MKPNSTLGLSLGMALLCGNQALSQTNQQLLQDGLISPLVFELLERQGAKTPGQRSDTPSSREPAVNPSCLRSTVERRDAEGTIDQEEAWNRAGHQETQPHGV